MNGRPSGADSITLEGVVLLEREQELQWIDHALAAARDGVGACLLVRGPAGIGKSSLLAEARARARGAGSQVLSAKGGVFEREFPFGVARQLIDSAAADPVPEDMRLGGAAVTPVLTGGAVAPMPPDGPLAAIYGLYSECANLSQRRRLLLLIDDAHWSDDASLRFVDFLVRRIDQLPITVMIAARSGEGVAAESIGILGELAASRSVQILEPGPLSRAAALQLTRAAFGEAADAGFAAACHERTAGNPFLLSELHRELASEGIAPTAAAAPRVSALTPSAVGSVELARLARLGDSAVALARAVALLGDRAQLADAAELADLSLAEAASAARALTAAGVFDRGPVLAFVHPLLRDVLDLDTPAPVRVQLHARAARVLAGHGRDPERVAAHLLLGPALADPWVVDVLREAARFAVARGAPDAAVPLLARAMQEPPSDGGQRAETLGELGAAEAALQHPGAVAHLTAARDSLAPGPGRAAAGLVLARVLALAGRSSEVYETVTDAQAGLGPGDRELALALEAVALNAGSIDPRGAELARERLERIDGLTALEGRTAGERAVLACAAFELAKAGHPVSDVVELAERAVPPGMAMAAETLTVLILVTALHWSGRISRAVELTTMVLDQASSTGSPTTFAEASTARALARRRAGMLAEAEADARQALATIGVPFGQAHSLATHALVGALTDRGEVTDAHALAAAFVVPPELPANAVRAAVECSRALADAATGRHEIAVDRFVAAGAILDAVGCVNPAGVEWRQPAALSLIVLGRRDEARELLAPALTVAHRSGGPCELGSALRVAALIEQPTSVDLLHEALSVLEHSEIRLEHARVLVDVGAALRRAGHRRDARAPLADALNLSKSCGASSLAERARTELLASGARPRSVVRTGADELTPSERRVAMLVIDGLSNPEIAQALFVTRATVESHLHSAYRKLNIDSRRELAQALHKAAG